MACFMVPAAEAVVTTIITKREEAKEKKEGLEKKDENTEAVRVPLSRKLHWLNNLLGGGAVLLAFEHLWHGEVAPWFPFLTGASHPVAMFHEMATVGVTMAGLITAVWFVMCYVVDSLAKKEHSEDTVKEGEGN